jgi:hypothetical protein
MIINKATGSKGMTRIITNYKPYLGRVGVNLINNTVSECQQLECAIYGAQTVLKRWRFLRQERNFLHLTEFEISAPPILNTNTCLCLNPDESSPTDCKEYPALSEKI